jgi:hypothetical protein
LGGRFGLAGGLLRVAAHHLLDAHRKRAPGLDTHERQGEEGQPWDGLAVQARTETIQAMRALASLGDDDFIARDEGDVTRTGHWCRKKTQNRMCHGMTVAQKRWMVRELPPWPAQRAIPPIVTRPVIATSATIIRLNWRTVVRSRADGSIATVLQYRP